MSENTPEETPDENEISLVPRNGLLSKIRYYFLTGLVVAAPIGITAYLAWAFIDTIDRNVTPLIPKAYNPETYLPFGIPGFGLVIVILFLTVLGALTANLFGRAFLRFGEKLLNRMPIVRSIYHTLKQIFETVVAQNAESFKDVVLVEYPRRGIWAIAFVTSENKGEIQNRLENEIINVFLPTTPNPTSGFLLFVPKRDLIYLDMSPDEGVKYVISAGLVDPNNGKDQNLQKRSRPVKGSRISDWNIEKPGSDEELP
ncbi:DUF502 domain-containing protein [Emcibacter sp.]|uniref:DUF502 domain-containing protein n=1 Tax=Emcibacter sp. TaxID=1979954 RepID=UPI002AA83D29|nr:DUF502 domain-containing protein [Emcibacter sp.]